MSASPGGRRLVMTSVSRPGPQKHGMVGRGTGIFSFARYGAPEPATRFRRAVKVLLHEIGHL